MYIYTYLFIYQNRETNIMPRYKSCYKIVTMVILNQQLPRFTVYYRSFCNCDIDSYFALFDSNSAIGLWAT